jgi:FecR-like protein
VQGHPILFLLRLTLVISLFLLAATDTQAQNDVVRTSVRSVTGIAWVSAVNRSGPFHPKKNDQLEPGNTIETGYNGRVVIALTDGGQITVLPYSKVILKHFPVTYSPRELLEILMGRVLVKIHHVGGKPNPYRLNSPAASIAVRGTEFIVDVLPSGETLVLVREGQVEVWPRNNPGNKRLVTPGGRVIVRPGGDISSTFPGPRRSFVSMSQDGPAFFSAFPDRHLDCLENPAYAADFKDAEGRLSLLPSVSAPYRSDLKGNATSKDPPSFDYSIFPQLTFFTPIPGSRLVIGGGVSVLRTRLEELVDFQFPENKLYDHEVSKLNASNLSLIAAYSFGTEGKMSAGIGIDRSSGDEVFSGDSNSNSNTPVYAYNSRYFERLNSRFARTRVTLGFARRFSEGKKLGLYYRQGFSSSDQEGRREAEYQSSGSDSIFNHSYSYFAPGKANTSTVSYELGARFRAPLTRRLFYGIEGSYLYERIYSQVETPGQPIDYGRYLARRARLGGGVGFALTSRILLNFDVAGGLYNDVRPINIVQSPWLYTSGDSSLAISSVLSRASRGGFVSAHAAAQATVWRNLFLSTSSLMTVNRNSYGYSYSPFKDSYKLRNYLYNVGLGWKVKPNFVAEYLLSVDPDERFPSHSLRLRYTFNLGGAVEK